MTSIAIDEVQWAGVRRAHRPILLVLAGIFGFLGLVGFAAANSSPALGLGIVVALVCVVLYFLGRRGIVEIAGGTGLITQPIGGAETDRNQALSFVSKVEANALAARLVRP
jgi:hypothetical protein